MSTALRPSLRSSNISSIPLSIPTSSYICQQCRYARLLRRPKRPYTFTQLVTLSDGSAFTMRTTSPLPVYRSTRDTRNSPLWNPSSRELVNVEDDEAGRLAKFRSRYGTGFDANRQATREEASSTSEEKPVTKEETSTEEDFTEDDLNLLDLISSYGQENAAQNQALGGDQSKKSGKSNAKKKVKTEYRSDDLVNLAFRPGYFLPLQMPFYTQLRFIPFEIEACESCLF